VSSRRKTRTCRISAYVLLGLVLLAGIPAFAQSCALCYTQAASATARFIQALRSGIIILMIPPMFMTIGFTVMAYRKRHHYRSDDPERPNGGW